MSFKGRKQSVHSIDDRVRLAIALGFTATNTSVEPYLDYILKQYTGNATTEEYVELFIEVVEHFRSGASANATPTIQTLLDKYSSSGFRNVFSDTPAGDLKRKEHVEDTVMCICGTWTAMLSSFQHRSRSSKVVAAYNLFAARSTPHAATTTTAAATPITTAATQPAPNTVGVAPYNESVAGLINGSGLLPGGQWDYIISYENDAATRLAGQVFNVPGCSNQNPTQKTLTFTCGQAPTSQIFPYELPYALLGDLNAQEAQSVRATKLNAFTLNVLSAVDILWTPNVSRHMLLTKVGGRAALELFSLPCALGAITSPTAGISIELGQEIEDTYAVLFNAWDNASWHARRGKFLGIHKVCWCWSCSAARYRQRCIISCRTRAPVSPRHHKRNVTSNMHQGIFDPKLEELMTGELIGNWTPEVFPKLWPRIARLEQHLQTSRPWSLSVLFRDRRDTMQFWTFLFATVVVFLTFVQVLVGVAQVVGSFK
ncbi:hypothetical protein CC86DRAFT_364684 [Ophiobolus disseminans]|uniref:Uncharacterized protein n=1 Tax=Ophiobolus disseminans TaxID=1469910 RepID=A0A6A6ZBN2_9PLEO|nr:hypothetical protein CC86DRAFT_364684 [Ophiobolus disseminans]